MARQPSHGEDDHGLIQRFLQGDEAAVYQVFRQYDPRLRALLRRGFRDTFQEADADDILNDSWAKILHQRNSYDRRKASFSRWSFVIVSRTAIDVLRCRKRGKVLPLCVTSEELDLVSLKSWRTGGQQVSSQEDARRTVENVYRWIETLNDAPQKRLMQLTLDKACDVKVTDEAIAKELGWSVENVRTKRSRLSQRLAEYLLNRRPAD